MRVILYGDSMTEYLHRPPRVLAAALQRLRGDVAWDVLNYAIGGTRAELILYRTQFEYWHGRDKMKPLAETQPDVLVMESCAYNNSQDQAAGVENLIHVWEKILAVVERDAPRAKVLMHLTLPPSEREGSYTANRLIYGCDPAIYAVRLQWRTAYQEAFAQFAARRGLPMADVRAEVLAAEALGGASRDDYIGIDGVHPNPLGVEFISDRLAAGVNGLV